VGAEAFFNCSAGLLGKDGIGGNAFFFDEPFNLGIALALEKKRN